MRDTSDMERVLVIVVSYNGMQWAERCFSSLRQAGEGVDTIVIDNGSTDGTVEYISEHFPEVMLHKSSKNLGFGAANNIGLRYALKNGYDYVYLLNQDAWIYPDTIEKLKRAATLHPEYGVLSPMQYGGDEKNLDPGFERIYLKVLEAGSGEGEQEIRDKADEMVEMPFVMAAHWFMPRRSFEKIGGFSPTFFHYGEDNNYIDRVKYHGLRVGVLPTAKCVHDRYERPVSKEKRLYLKDTSNLIRLSDPSVSLIVSIIKSVIYSIGFSIKERSVKPLTGIIGQLGRISEIRYNRKKTKGDKAFL